MFRPEQNWQPASSYVEPVVPPSVAPDAAPLVSPCFSAAWLPYVLGSLAQLAQPTTWDSTSPSVVQLALDRAQDLMALFADAGGCMEIRWHTATCSLQESTDNGATWTDISGWDLPGFQACIMAGLSIRVDGGNLQWSIDGGSTWIDVGGWPPPPVTVPGQSTSDQACSIANYLARDVIQQGLAQAVNSYNSAESTLQNWARLSDLLIFWEPILPIVLNAAAGLYGLYTSGSIANLTAASTDPQLVADVTCAIYGAIVAAGEVTDANYAALYAAILAVSYPSTDARNAVTGFVNQLGARGLEALQVGAPWAVGSCLPCGPANAIDCTGAGTHGVILANNVVVGAHFDFAMWIDMSVTSGAYTLASFGQNIASVGGFISMFISGNNLSVYVGNAVTNVSVGTAYTLTNSAHLVGFTIQPGFCACYLDGNNVSSTTPPTPPYIGASPITEFGNHVTGVHPMSGKFWRAAAYNRNLSSAEWTAWFTRGTSGAPPANPAYFWPCTEGTGTIMGDAADHDNGTLGTGVVWGTHP